MLFAQEHLVKIQMQPTAAEPIVWDSHARQQGGFLLRFPQMLSVNLLHAALQMKVPAAALQHPATR
jgi:hypothetical protein